MNMLMVPSVAIQCIAQCTRANPIMWALTLSATGCLQGAIEICQEGVEPSEGLVNVNNKLVPDSTPLRNGDYIVLSRHLININKTGSS